jgi:dienelactone hydrolase
MSLIAIASGSAEPRLNNASAVFAGDIAGAGQIGDFMVGHTRVAMTLMSSDTPSKVRPIDVELWYPAVDEEWGTAAPTVYRSRLWGVSLTSTIAPLSFQIVSRLAREGVSIKPGRRYPLVIHSHGTNGQPFDVADILELVASHGYVVAAPWHTGNNHDDLRADVVNTAARRQVLPCQNGSQFPQQRCLDSNVGRTIADRVLDLRAVQENITVFLGDQVDTSNVAIFGYSRGGVAAMAAAGGSTAFGVTPMDGRLKGIFAWAGGASNVMDPVDVHLIDRPAVVVTSTGDQLVSPLAMKQAYDEMPTREKAIFQLDNATHGSIRSNTCDEMQAAGAVRLTNPQAFLENDRLIRLLGPGAISTGTAYTYCEYPSFSTPVDITNLVASPSIGGLLPTASNVPSQLSTLDCVRATTELLLAFFHVVLSPSGSAHFSDGGFLNPRYALNHEPALATAEATYLPSEQDQRNRYDGRSIGDTYPDFCLNDEALLDCESP